jgi:hypothetical protein
MRKTRIEKTRANSRSIDAAAHDQLPPLGGDEQTLPDEFPGTHPWRTREQAASDMGCELIEHIELRHLLEDRNKAGAWVPLIRQKEKPGVVFHSLAPGRPTLRGEVHAVVV